MQLLPSLLCGGNSSDKSPSDIWQLRQSRNLKGVDLKNGDSLKTGKWFRKWLQQTKARRMPENLSKSSILPAGLTFSLKYKSDGGES